MAIRLRLPSALLWMVSLHCRRRSGRACSTRRIRDCRADLRCIVARLVVAACTHHLLRRAAARERIRVLRKSARVAAPARSRLRAFAQSGGTGSSPDIETRPCTKTRRLTQFSTSGFGLGSTNTRAGSTSWGCVPPKSGGNARPNWVGFAKCCMSSTTRVDFDQISTHFDQMIVDFDPEPTSAKVALCSAKFR